MKNKTLLSLLVLSLIGPMDIAAKGKIEFDEIKDLSLIHISEPTRPY